MKVRCYVDDMPVIRVEGKAVKYRLDPEQDPDGGPKLAPILDSADLRDIAEYLLPCGTLGTLTVEAVL